MATDDRKAGKAEALTEMAGRIPQQIARPQAASFEAELQMALKRVGLQFDPGTLAKIAQAHRALLVVRAQRLGKALTEEALSALMGSTLGQESVSPLPLPSGSPGTESAREGIPRPTNGSSRQTGDPPCS